MRKYMNEHKGGVTPITRQFRRTHMSTPGHPPCTPLEANPDRELHLSQITALKNCAGYFNRGTSGIWAVIANLVNTNSNDARIEYHG